MTLPQPDASHQMHFFVFPLTSPIVQSESGFALDHHNGDNAMLACAFLPFLPLIIDAHIIQLGDRRDGKRMEAERFLDKAMQNRRGLDSYLIYEKIKTALNVENKIIAAGEAQGRRDYDEGKKNSLTGLRSRNDAIEALHPAAEEFLLMDTGVEARKKALDKENLQGLKDIFGDLLDSADYWGVNRPGRYFAIFSWRKLTPQKIDRLMEIRKKSLGVSAHILTNLKKSEVMKMLKDNNAAKLQR
jgi:hypothetical protein